MSSQRHQWTEEEDQTLCEVVDTLGEMKDQFKYQKEFWSSVAATMAYKSSLIISGDACRHRWQGLQPKDKWDEVAEMAETYERELLEDLEHNLKLTVDIADTHLANIRSKLEALGVQVDWLAKELGWGQEDKCETDTQEQEKSKRPPKS